MNGIGLENDERAFHAACYIQPSKYRNANR
jgi:hypothetical protein